MRTHPLREIKLKLPADVVNTITESDIVGLLSDMALGKAEYYRSKCKQFETKYGADLSSFNKKAEEAQNEDYESWDDSLVWEGYECASKEWQKKYEELQDCLK